MRTNVSIRFLTEVEISILNIGLKALCWKGIIFGMHFRTLTGNLLDASYTWVCPLQQANLYWKSHNRLLNTRGTFILC